MTLTFVPKMIAVLVAASLTASFVGGKFSIFTQSIQGIEGIGEGRPGGHLSLWKGDEVMRALFLQAP